MKQLKIKDLKWICPKDVFNFKTTEEIKPITEIIGQKTAIESIKIGLHIRSPGYNIFITGLAGTGRKSIVHRFLKKSTKDYDCTLEDILYFYNFDNPDEPKVFKVKTNEGGNLVASMLYLAEKIEDFILTIFNTDIYYDNLITLEKKQKKEEEKIFKEINKLVKKYEFEWIHSPQDPSKLLLLPFINGKVVDFTELAKLVKEKVISHEAVEQIKKKKSELEQAITISLNEIRTMKHRHLDEINKLDRKTASPLTDIVFEDLKVLTTSKEVKNQLDVIKEFFISNISVWKNFIQSDLSKVEWAVEKKNLQNKMRIFLAVNNSSLKRRPIIIENFPTEKNLFGSIDISNDSTLNHLNVKSGSLLKAHKGYIVIDAIELIQENDSWQRLKRTLKTGRLEISPIATQYSTGGYLRPDPVEIDVKVILIGKEELYSAMYLKDPEFSKIFKIKANFEHKMPLSNKNLKKYASFVALITQRDNLLPFSRNAVKVICEYAYRLAEGRKFLSTKFGKISDLVKESNYWEVNTNPKAKFVSDMSVKKAILKKRERHNSFEKGIFKLIEDGIIKINFSGEKIGQINGLTIIEDEENLMGLPVRISAQTSPGRKGVISIERESNLSGEMHTKGILIINGFLRGRYSSQKPLSLQATICFEQTYSMIDGDSATCAEMCVLLSSLTKIPIKQNFAITGSADQYGNVQAVGGINEKIEGFYKICKIKNIKNGSVIIPEDNIVNLQLNDDVIEDIKKSKFFLYSASHIDEILQLITDVPVIKTDKKKKTTEIRNFNTEIKKSLELMSRTLEIKTKENKC